MPQTPRFHIPFDEGAISIGASTLLIRPASTDGMELFDKETTRFSQGFLPVHQAFLDAGFKPDEGSEQADLAVVFVTRSRAETLGNIASAYARLTIGGWLVVDGIKKDGIDAILRQVRKSGADTQSRAKSHGKVFWLQKSSDTLPAEWLKSAALTQNKDGYQSAPGMFSAAGIDTGSAALAGHLSKDMKGKAADLGAGWGYLSLALLEIAENIEHLDLFEAEISALDAARQNINDPRAEFHWTDVSSIAPSFGPYDLILSNPPFHQSRMPDPSLGIGFIATAARLLSRKGTFLMVANQQLPYEAELTRLFTSWTQLELTGGFKIIRAVRPKKV